MTKLTEGEKELIAFFTAKNFFRKQTEDKRKKVFDENKEEYKENFDHTLTQFDYDFLMHVAEEKKRKKIEAEKRKLEREEKPLTRGFDDLSEYIRVESGTRFVLTCAQNNTPVAAYKALLQFCKHIDAKLLIAKMTYDKNGYQQPAHNMQDGLWYAPEITKYLVDDIVKLSDRYHFIANANVIPTDKNPINGFESATEPGVNCIIPASKIQLKIVANLPTEPTKILTSTGTITQKNYILRKAGTVAAHEHNIGAVFVDTELDKLVHLEIMPGTDSFYDMNWLYTPNNAIEVEKHVVAFQPGDLHAEKLENKNFNDVLELIFTLKPQNLLVHDLLDFSSRNHHNIKDCTFIHLQNTKNKSVKDDLTIMADLVDELIQCTEAQIHIVESNHDLALLRWLKETDFKQDSVNALTYLTLMKKLYEYQEMTGKGDFNVLKYAYEKIGKGKYANEPDTLHFHTTDESIKIAGVEMGHHGHNGINGARGNPQQLRGLSLPMNTGHTHSPSIWGKVYTAGVTAAKNMGYNIGASSWRHAHIVTYTNGQRQILFTD